MGVVGNKPSLPVVKYCFTIAIAIAFLFPAGVYFYPPTVFIYDL